MRLRALVLALAVIGGSAAAQTKPETPEAVVQRYVDAMRGRNWRGMAALIDPQALQKFRAMVGAAAKSEQAGPLRDQLFGGASVTQLDSLSDQEFFARFLGAAMSQSPELQTMMDSASVRVIGHVDESPNLTHVVYSVQLDVGPVRVSKPDVLTLRRSGNSWLALLRADLEIMAAALEQRFRS